MINKYVSLTETLSLRCLWGSTGESSSERSQEAARRQQIDFPEEHQPGRVSQGQGKIQKDKPKGREETGQRDHPDTKQRTRAQEGLSFHQVWPLIDQTSTCRGFKVMETSDSGRKVGSGEEPHPPQATLHMEDKTGRCFLLCCLDSISESRGMSWQGSRPNASESEKRVCGPTSLRRREKTNPQNHRVIVLDGGGQSRTLCEVSPDRGTQVGPEVQDVSTWPLTC